MDEPLSYRVRLLKPAARDVQELYDYIRFRSPSGALSWYDAFLDAIDRLQRDPIAPGTAPENDYVEEEIRQALVKTRHGHIHRILYTLVGDQVRVLRVRRAGQDLLRPVEIA